MSKYYRGLISSINDVKYKLQLASMTLKINENKNNITGIKNDISGINNFSDKINDNETNISDNLSKIDTNTGDISTNSELINTNTEDIASNLAKINNIENDIKLSNEYNETFVIPHKSTNNWDVGTIFDKIIKFKFTSNGIIKINAKYNYDYDTKYNFKHVYRFYYNQTAYFNRTELYHNRISNIVTDEFEIKSIDISEIRLKIYLITNSDSQQFKLNDNSIQFMYNETNLKLDINKNNIESNLEKIKDNTSDITSNSGLISTNTSSIASNLGKINTNTGSISSNLGKINTNTSNISDNLEKITALQTSNVKAFYNLDQIFIYDIPKKDGKMVDKNNHLHIFEKEIIYNFTKNSYLEIALKVLTEVSNYVLIGFFQVLCNFYDQDNNLFHTISLSTAMGSINKLSTIKSVFIVPINENMSKIKIDFFIAPKETQQNRSAIFTIKDINSNKIYIKYFQKTEEMSIKDIKDNLNRVSDLENKLYLKNFSNTLYHKNDVQIDHIFFEKLYTINSKPNDFLEIQFKILLKYEDSADSRHITTNIILYDDDLELMSYTFDNNNYISDSNTDVLLNDSLNYTFDKNVTNLKMIISFTKRRSYVKISYSSINTNRLIIKHYGN